MGRSPRCVGKRRKLKPGSPNLRGAPAERRLLHEVSARRSRLPIVEEGEVLSSSNSPMLVVQNHAHDVCPTVVDLFVP